MFYCCSGATFPDIIVSVHPTFLKYNTPHTGGSVSSSAQSASEPSTIDVLVAKYLTPQGLYLLVVAGNILKQGVSFSKFFIFCL